MHIHLLSTVDVCHKSPITTLKPPLLSSSLILACHEAALSVHFPCCSGRASGRRHYKRMPYFRGRKGESKGEGKCVYFLFIYIYIKNHTHLSWIMGLCVGNREPSVWDPSQEITSLVSCEVSGCMCPAVRSSISVMKKIILCLRGQTW